MIIGLSGYARSGKDTAAEVLVEEFGFKRVAFADKLREVLYALDPIILWDDEWHRMKGVPEYMPLKWIIDEWGWDGYKATGWSKHIRKLLQRLGTEAGRYVLGENVWVDAAFASGADRIVVTDCRFVNEATAIKHRGGEVWRINRHGVGPINDHVSETGLDNWPFDLTLFNGGGLNLFKEDVKYAAIARGV